MTTPRISRAAVATLAAAAVLLAPAASAHSPGPAHATTTATSHAASRATALAPGSLVSATEVVRLGPAQLDAAVAEAGIRDATPARYGVTAYRLVYRTRDHQGRPTTASGLVVLPDGRRGALRVAAYLHGTNATRSAAATLSADSTDRLIAAMFAGAGMAAVAPDYLGLGLGPGSPPYLDLATEVGSTTDLLEAARAFVRTRGVVLRREVMVTGFSQGGRTSLAVARALQQGEAGWFRLGGVSAVAGPYDVLGTELPAVFRGEVPAETAVYYLAYLVTAWDRTVGLYDDPRDAFQPAYAEVVEGWFDGSHTYEELERLLPNRLTDLFTPAFLDELRHPTGVFRRALAEGDRICRDWTPRVPVTLYTGTADTDVVPANATACARDLTRRGASVTVRSMGAVDHSDTARAAYPLIVRELAAGAAHTSNVPPLRQ